MKHKYLVGATLMLAALIFAFGCSDDDSGTPPDQGNLDDPAFQFMDIFGDGMNNINLVAIEKMSYMIDSVMANETSKLTGKAQYDIDYYPGGYTESGGWYVFDDSMYVTATDSYDADSIYYSGTDSLGFYGDGSLMAPPVWANMDSLLLKCDGNHVIYGDDSTHLNMDYSAGFTITGDEFGADTITIDGTAQFTITGTLEFDTDIACDVSITMTLTYDNLTFDWVDDLVPFQGNASATAAITQTCASGSTAPDISGTWTASWVVGSGQVTKTFNRGDDTWVYTESMD